MQKPIPTIHIIGLFSASLIAGSVHAAVAQSNPLDVTPSTLAQRSSTVLLDAMAPLYQHAQAINAGGSRYDSCMLEYGGSDAKTVRLRDACKRSAILEVAKTRDTLASEFQKAADVAAGEKQKAVIRRKQLTQEVQTLERRNKAIRQTHSQLEQRGREAVRQLKSAPTNRQLRHLVSELKARHAANAWKHKAFMKALSGKQWQANATQAVISGLDGLSAELAHLGELQGIEAESYRSDAEVLAILSDVGAQGLDFTAIAGLGNSMADLVGELTQSRYAGKGDITFTAPDVPQLTLPAGANVDDTQSLIDYFEQLEAPEAKVDKEKPTSSDAEVAAFRIY